MKRWAWSWVRGAPQNLAVPEFKFGTRLVFANAHHKTTPRGKVGVALGEGSSYIFGVPL